MLQHSTVHSDSTQAPWVPFVKNTFIDVREPSENPEHIRRRCLKPVLSCGDTPHPFTLRESQTDEDMVVTCQRQLSGNDSNDSNICWVPTIKNTFVNLVDVSARDCKRKLKSVLSCGDVPDPTTNVVDPPIAISDEVRKPHAQDAVMLDEKPNHYLTHSAALTGLLAYTGSPCTNQKMNRSPSDSALTAESIAPQIKELVVDAKKLKSTGKRIVLPIFPLKIGSEEATFRLIITAKSDRGCTSFSKSCGRGSVQLKCQTAISQLSANVSYSIWVGNRTCCHNTRGPFCHNFVESALCDVPAGSGLWDFSAAVDPATSAFVVGVEVISPFNQSEEYRTPRKAHLELPSQPTREAMRSSPLITPEKEPLSKRLFLNGLGIDESSLAMLKECIGNDWSLSSSSDSDSSDSDRDDA